MGKLQRSQTRRSLVVAICIRGILVDYEAIIFFAEVVNVVPLFLFITMFTVISSLVSPSATERETNRDDRCTKKMHISEKGYIKREEEEDLKKRTS